MEEGRILFHVDLDAFYAAVEVRDDPALRKVPLVIGADPKDGRGRGIVCTANYPARAFGIRSAMPISEAYRRAPHAVFRRPDFSRYGPASRKVMDVLRRYADVLEVAGWDEAYLDMSDVSHGDWAYASSLARSLQAAVKRETGLSISVGVAPSKSVAKVASDKNKPHGVCVVRPGEVVDFLRPLRARALNGCGPKTAARLADAGLVTVGELQDAPLERLVALLGSTGRWLWHTARGDDDRRVHADRGPAKSHGNERTFGRDQADMAKVRDAARRLATEGIADLGEARFFSTVTVKLRYRDFTTLTRAYTFAWPLDARDPASEAELAHRVEALLVPLLDGRPIRLVGVRLSKFTDAGQQRLTAWSGDLGLREPATHGAPAGAFDPGLFASS